MELNAVTLQYFRSYKKQIFSFSETLTLIVGPNTAGKTNILEAIYMLAIGKSFRAEKDSDCIKWGKEVGRIIGKVTERESEETALELVLTKGMVQGQKAPMKKYLVNGVPRRHVDFVGHLSAVLFSPEDLDLVIDSPSVRRAYLNSVLVQVDREYRRNLLSYERGLRQRNKLLFLIHEGKASRSQLLFWNQLLIKAGSYITKSREEFINAVNIFILDDLSYKLTYDPSLISQARLEQYKEEEIGAKTTLVGPQRDDFIFEKNITKEPHFVETPRSRYHSDNSEDTWRDVSRFGSRGEQRLAVLWLKLAELSFIENKVGQRPILLLDDIFSELDSESRSIVLSIIKEQQTIITSADEEVMHLLKKYKDSLILHLPIENV